MLPPPAITIRRTGSSCLRISLMHAADVAARGEEEDLVAVFDDRVAVGRYAAAGAVDGHHARFGVRQMFAAVLAAMADEQAALRARTPTSCTWPSAKSSTCSAPGYWISRAT